MFSLPAYLAQQRQMIQAALDTRMPPADTPPADLHRAMRHSLLAGGKRLRPIICLAAARAAGASDAADSPALLPALALEALHTYTLVHDDLPAMDDDDLRRGQPACHVAYGEATAILAGDALLTLAFEWLAQAPAPPGRPPGCLARELAQAAGSLGVVGGQAADLAAAGQAPDPGLVDFIHRRKTAALFRAASRLGGLAAGAGEQALSSLGRYGEQCGLAFQIVDDILNETSSAAELGKAVHTDRRREKMSYVAVHGLAAARQRAAALTATAVNELAGLPETAAPLRAIAAAMARRTT